jgi:hypothetical protein
MKMNYGTLKDWHEQRKAELLGEKTVAAPLSPPKISHGLIWNRIRASAVTGRQLNA